MPKSIICEYITQKMYQLRYEIVHSVTKFQRSRNGVDVFDISSHITREQSARNSFRRQHIGEHCPFKLTHIKIVLLHFVT